MYDKPLGHLGLPRGTSAAYEGASAGSNAPVDEPRDNLWMTEDSLCAWCAQLVENSWDRAGHYGLEQGLLYAQPVDKKNL
jgi:hypothetical protein